MKKLLLAALLAAVQLPAFAAGSSAGTVSYLFVHDPGILLFAVAGGQQTPAACSNLGQWAVDLNTTLGKNMYALLLSAQSQGQTVTVAGSGTCTAWGDREKPMYLYVNP